MSRKRRRIPWIVSGFGKTAMIVARTAGHAVAQFRRAFRLTLRADPETGGWKHLSVSPATGNRQPTTAP